MTPSQPPDARIAALDALFTPFCRSDAPGLVVGVSQHGSIRYRRGFGLACVALGAANTPWTRMRIGSTSKQFTCLAALLLAEDGLLDIDASVRRYLPELPVVGPEPSLRQLMNHTSGLRCYLDLGSIADGMAMKPLGFAWEVQRRQREANFAPGTDLIYCNSGYQLLSRVIASVAGQPFEQFLQERIFAPLGMHDTASVPSDFELRPGQATLHLPRGEGGWQRGIFPTEELRGEGAMVSTVDDMLRWLAHLREPRVGNAESWRQMLAPTRLSSGKLLPYGLGLMRHDYRGVEVIHHAGAVIGGSCQMLSVSDHALDIILICNGAPCSPRELALRIVDLMLGDELLGPAMPLAEAARFAPLLGRRYRSGETGLVFGFSRAGAQGSALGLSLLEGPPMALRDEGELLCKPFEEAAIGLLQVPSAQLRGVDESVPRHLDLIVNGRCERCELLPETAPANAEVPLLGRYRCPELDAEGRIEFDGEQLVLKIRGAYGSNRVALSPISADVFGCHAIGVPLGHGGVAVLRVSTGEGRIHGFRLDTPRTRQLAFERYAD